MVTPPDGLAQGSRFSYYAAGWLIVNFRKSASRILLASLNMAISVLQFLVLLELANQAVQVYRKMASFLALASMIPLALAELTFTIIVYNLYFRFTTPRSLARKFLEVTGVQFLIFAAIVVFELIVFAPFARAAEESFTALMTTRDYVQFFAGIGLGLLLLLAPRRLLAEEEEPKDS